MISVSSLQTLDECIEKKIAYCSNAQIIDFTVARYFCGQDAICRYRVTLRSRHTFERLLLFSNKTDPFHVISRCRNPSRAGLELAKRNVERFYSVVGYLENFPQFLEVLQEIFPQFFTNVTKSPGKH